MLRLRRNLGTSGRSPSAWPTSKTASDPQDRSLSWTATARTIPGTFPGCSSGSRNRAVRIVFAERTRRSESLVFRVFYALYKLLHRLLTGQGCGSAISARSRGGGFEPGRCVRALEPLCGGRHPVPAALLLIPTRRSPRLCGRSTMNFVSLVTHGLSAISVHSDVVGVRLLVVSVLLALLTVGGIVAAVSSDWRPIWPFRAGRPSPSGCC